MEPIFSFYPEDVQPNGNISEQAVIRECSSLTPKLISELKYLDHGNKPISVRIGDKDIFKVQFLNQNNMHGKDE